SPSQTSLQGIWMAGWEVYARRGVDDATLCDEVESAHNSRAEERVTKIQSCAGLVMVCALATLGTSDIGRAQVVAKQVVDKNGAPQYRVDPFWPKPLPNKWSMQQVVGIWVDQMDHVWFLNRGVAAIP